MTQDQKLQLALAKMLPKKIKIFEPMPEIPSHNHYRFWWKKKELKIRETEWLHVCWLVEQTFNEVEQIKYVATMWRNNQPIGFKGGYDWNQQKLSDLIWWTLASASWQQRAEALCRAKGITV